MKKTVIQVSDLHLSINGKTLLQNLNFSIHAGEIVGIIGPNSAGKSTLLKTLLGLYKPALKQGSIHILNKNLTQWHKNELARTVAYLAQNSQVHWPMTVSALVALGRLPYRQSFGTITDKDEKIINQAMVYTGTHTLKNRIATQLSGGELARVLMARAIAVNSCILLADEPVAHLDPYYQLSILELLKQKARNNMAVVVVLHDFIHAARFCDRLLLLNGGKLVAQGNPNQVLQSDIIRKHYQVTLAQAQIENKAYPVPWEIDPQSYTAETEVKKTGIADDS